MANSLRLSDLAVDDIKALLPKTIVNTFDNLFSISEDELENVDWQEVNQALENLSMYRQELPQGELSKLFAAGYTASVTPFDVISDFTYIDGEPYDAKKYGFMAPLLNVDPKYNLGSRRQVWVASRQTGKSSSQACSMVGHAIINTKMKALHVSPRESQARLFSQQRFRPLCERSPKIAEHYIRPSQGLWQAMARQFITGPFFNFRSCYNNADTVRGITASHLYLDEYQDLPAGDSTKVIESVQMSYSTEETFRYYAGTHKTSDNQLNVLWENSCQFERIVTCSGCRHDNFVDETIIQDDKYACAKCGKEIDPKGGLWVPMQPQFLDKQWGFRIPQMMMPHRTHADIIAERDSPMTTQRAYYNEVLAKPYDAGKSGLSRQQFRDACDPNQPMMTPDEIFNKYGRGGFHIFAGVDYGTGDGNPPSYTVLTLGIIDRADRVRVLYIKKFTGPEADLASQPARIDNICKAASNGRVWLGADWGFGADKNAVLCSTHGWKRMGGMPGLLEFKYVTQHLEATWKKGNYHVDRNQTMERTFEAIKNCDKAWGIVFPRYSDVSFIEADMTAPRSEMNEDTNRYKYVHSVPDDGFHSLNYLYMSARQIRNKLVTGSLPSI